MTNKLRTAKEDKEARGHVCTEEDEDKQIAEVIRSARTIQEFLWGGFNGGAGLEEFKRMYRKRIAKIDAIEMSNPHWKVELRKRLLQVAAISVNLIYKLDNNETIYEGTHPSMETNLPEYADPTSCCGACGDHNVFPTFYYNKEKRSTIRLCRVCSKTAYLNGYELI